MDDSQSQAILKAKNVLETNRAKEGEGAARAIAAMIRQESEQGKLISESEIFSKMTDQHLLALPPADPVEEVRNILRKCVEESEDLYELSVEDGSRRYYSSHFMTETYARILLQKQGDPLRLIAETVRKNSAVYPRPVPLDIFTQPPFDLARQEVLNNLERMAADEQYRDILPTTTSAYSVFLYSTLHLEPDHAAMLAEWLDVGRFNNP
jgi:hypothetical protein